MLSLFSLSLKRHSFAICDVIVSKEQEKVKTDINFYVNIVFLTNICEHDVCSLADLNYLLNRFRTMKYA